MKQRTFEINKTDWSTTRLVEQAALACHVTRPAPQRCDEVIA
jgi:hypothetical protein